MALTGKAADRFQEWIDGQLYTRFISQNHISELDEVCKEALEAEFLNTFNYEGQPLFDYCFGFYWKWKTQELNFQIIFMNALGEANGAFNASEF